MKHIIHNMDLFISNNKFLGILGPKEQYFGISR